jgi:hypothetical protein
MLDRIHRPGLHQGKDHDPSPIPLGQIYLGFSRRGFSPWPTGQKLCLVTLTLSVLTVPQGFQELVERNYQHAFNPACPRLKAHAQVSL